MSNKRTMASGDSLPVTGGIPLPSSLTATPLTEDLPPDDELGRQAYWLLKLHADKVSRELRQSDLAGMNDAAKRQLIADIQFALGIAPFKGDTL